MSAGKSALIVLALGFGLSLTPVWSEETLQPGRDISLEAISTPAVTVTSTQAVLPPGTLRNIDFLPRPQTSRPPSRPRKFLRRRNLKTRAERDEKYVQLLLVSVGFVSMFIVILALRSMPPAKKRA